MAAGQALVLLALVVLAQSLGAAAQTAKEPIPVHSVDGSFVRDWLVIGPFLGRDIETDFLVEVGGEANVRPKEGELVTTKDGTQLRWTRLRSATDLQTPGTVIKLPDLCVLYAYCELESDEPLQTYLRAYSPAQGSIWLNGKNIGQPSPSIGGSTDMPPTLPLDLKRGRNRLLLKLSSQPDGADFLVQPLPVGWRTIDLSITDAEGQAIPGALVEFYMEGKLFGRVRAERQGQVCIKEGIYDLRVTSAEMGAWRFGSTISSDAHQRIEVQLGKKAISISGRVLAMDESPQRAIVVQAFRIAEDEMLPSPQKMQRIAGALPEFSETVLSDKKGEFRFVNLRPGVYQVFCHGPEGLIAPMGHWETGGDRRGVIVEPGKPTEGLVFMFPEAKKGIWKNYQIMEGLMEVQPTALERMSEGMLWIGTDQSFLYSLDGLGFRLAASAPEVPANEIEIVVKGTGDTIWIGTAGGIARYNSGEIQTIALPGVEGKNQVHDILSDEDGTAWFATRAGLYRYDGQRTSRSLAGEGILQEGINSLMRGRDGSLWIGTASGLLRYDGSTVTSLQPFTGFSGRGVANLHQAKDNAIWFTAVSGGGAYRYDGKTFTRLGVEHGLLSDSIGDIAETSDGTLWFATEMGLSSYNGRTIVNYTPEDGLSNQWVRDIFVDSDDVLWCANGWGLSRFDPKAFISFGQRDGLNRVAGPAEVFQVVPKGDGNVLVATGWRGVMESDGRTLRPMEGFSEGYVRQIHRSGDGTLWFGTSTGLLRQEGQQVVQVLARTSVLALCSDDEGNIWFGHGWHGGGVTRFDPRSGRETVFSINQGLPDDHVWALERSSGGGVWIGTSGGLAHYSGGPEEATLKLRTLQSSGVFHLRLDTDDILWIGTREGLDTLKGSERVRIGGTNKLPGHIWSSARTADGKIWMGTDRHGLLGFDGRAVTMLDKRDGMAGNSAFAVLTNSNNSLWVGFLDGGLTLYTPGKQRPSIRVEGILVDNQAVTNMATIPEVAVGHGVTFQYEEIDQKTHPEKRQFWYRLTRQSGETLFAGVTKERRFDWVPEKRGSYSFEVQAIDRDLNYSEPARVLLQVFVPWHANPWLLIPGGIGFSGLLVWALVVRALYVRKSREAVVLGERVRIARDLHDHLGAGLTHLAMVGDLVREKIHEPLSAQVLATRLTDSARELTRTMGEIIWATDPEKDTLQSFARFLTRYAERFFADSTLRLRFHIPPELPDVPVPAEVRNSLFLVAKEALNNVAKHAQATELRITLELRNRELHLCFEDDGQGFASTELADKGQGLDNMQKRLLDLGGHLEIHSEVGRGTRITATLRLPRK